MIKERPDIEFCEEFVGKDFEFIYETICKRNPDVFSSELMNCSQWIYSVVKSKDL